MHQEGLSHHRNLFIVYWQKYPDFGVFEQLYLYTVKKYFQDLLSQHILFSQINFIIIYLVEKTYYFEFLVIKLIYFIVLTHFFQFNQLKI